MELQRFREEVIRERDNDKMQDPWKYLVSP